MNFVLVRFSSVIAFAAIGLLGCRADASAMDSAPKYLTSTYWPGEKLPSEPAQLTWADIKELGKNKFGISEAVYIFYPNNWEPSKFDQAGHDVAGSVQEDKIQSEGNRRTYFKKPFRPSNAPEWDHRFDYPESVKDNCIQVERVGLIPWGFGEGKVGFESPKYTEDFRKNWRDVEKGIPWIAFAEDKIMLWDWSQKKQLTFDTKTLEITDLGKSISREKFNLSGRSGNRWATARKELPESFRVSWGKRFDAAFPNQKTIRNPFFRNAEGALANFRGEFASPELANRGIFLFSESMIWPVCQVSFPALKLKFLEANSPEAECRLNDYNGNNFLIESCERTAAGYLQEDPLSSYYAFTFDGSSIFYPMLSPAGIEIFRYKFMEMK